MTQESYRKTAEDILSRMLSPFSPLGEEGEKQLRVAAREKPALLLSVLQCLDKQEAESHTTNLFTSAFLMGIGTMLGVAFSLLERNLDTLIVMSMSGFALGILYYLLSSSYFQSRTRPAREKIVLL